MYYLHFNTGMFAFDLYDTDADGILTQVQVLKLYQESFGTKAPDHDELRA